MDSLILVSDSACQETTAEFKKWQDTVTLLLGPDEETIRAHTCFLVKSSRFFSVCLSGPWAESRNKVIRLPDIPPESFSLYLHWAYHGEIQGCEETPATAVSAVKNMTKAVRNHLAAARYVKLGKLAILADHLDDCALKNAVVDSIIITQNKFMFVPSPDVISDMWANLPPSSKIRNLVAKMFATLIDVNNLVKNRDKNPPDLIFDTVLLLRQDKVDGGVLQAPKLADRCHYHEHSPKEPQCPIMAMP